MKNFITIIGAGPGISNAVAHKFGKAGFGVALIARTAEKLVKMTADLKADGVEAMYAVADVGNEESLKKALASVHEQWGHAKMVLFNASVIDVKEVFEQTWETISQQLDVNAGGAFNLGKMVLPYCLKENTGKVFFTGGGFALQGDPTWLTLSVGKAAMRNIVQAFVKRVEKTNVHVAQVTVCGYVNPQDEKYSPEKIAELYWELYNQKPGEFKNEIIY